MLEEGRKRADDRNAQSLEWVCGDAEGLPLPDRAFDLYTVAFGLRNVTHVKRALREAWRVLAPGGHFLCLEFSRLQGEALRKLYDRYSFRVIPKLGRAIAGASEPYQYLVESIRRFPRQEEFSDMISRAGFARVRYRNLAGGVVAIHSGYRI